MKVSFIIPVYGNFPITATCIDSIHRTVNNIDYEIIIVDDASDESTQKSLETLRSESVQIIRNSVNSGYSHSNNVGARNAKGEYLFLLNNDLELLDGWIEPMLQGFEKVPNAGLIGNIQLNAETGKLDHAGQYIDWDTEIKHIQKPNTRFPNTFPYTKVSTITGACCAIKRQIFFDIGEFDEAFENGCEDVDLCFRLQDRGYKITVANQSRVKHWVSTTRKELNQNNERNYRYLQRKWSDKLARIASYQWPERYLAQIISQPSSFSFSLFKEAFPRWLTINKTPPQTGYKIATSRITQRDIHWKKVIDNFSDDELKESIRNDVIPNIKELYNYSGLKSTGTQNNGVWIQEDTTLTIPRGILASLITISGELIPANASKSEESGNLGLLIEINGIDHRIYPSIEEGKFKLTLEKLPYLNDQRNFVKIKLLGVGKTNAYAFLGRKLEKSRYLPKSLRDYLQKFRPQSKNKRLLIHDIQLNGETALDFVKNPTSPAIFEFIKRYGNTGINLIGWFKAELGIGESARLSAKALKTSSLNYALVPLKVNCLSKQGDTSLDNEFTTSNPYPINLFHIDAAQSLDIDSYHGRDFRKSSYNIGYWAWELPEFPDEWIKHFAVFDEIWTPSNFVRDAIAMKSPKPVITIPHCIEFQRPQNSQRSKFSLPDDLFLFEFIYDLNSYQERKNPIAVIQAFKRAFADSPNLAKVGLIIKTQSVEKHESEYKRLLKELEGITNYFIIDRTLSREDVYELIDCCDSYVSLHRSEGFGLTVAEAMYLGKPVISTHWSATSEFVNTANGCPVDFELIELTEDHGPYKSGQIWANPNIDNAAKHMLMLFENESIRSKLGKEAKRTIETLYSSKRIAQLYEQRVKSISLWHQASDT